jgi:hypothetical protein
MIDIKAFHTYVEIGTGPRKKIIDTGNGTPEMDPEK